MATALQLPRISLRPNKRSLAVGRHPWILAKSIESVEPGIRDGDVVDVVQSNGHSVGRGIYNSQSYIRVRMYSFSPAESLDTSFWSQRLEAAVAWRRQIGYLAPDEACRLVFSEGDGLSGLIVDRYGPYLVVQVTALAMERRIDELVPTLVDLTRPRGIYLRIDEKMRQAEGLVGESGIVWGEPWPSDLSIREHGIVYSIDIDDGQKTGFYLDQRENRRVAAAYTGGRRVLDMCCYVGGFGLTAAMLGGASEVWAVDSSERAIDRARGNAERNRVANIRFEVGDFFQTLETLAREKEKFAVVVLDPPRFAGNRQSIDQALRAYHRLNRLAVEVLEPAGVLITCSCSGRVSREEFAEMLCGVARRTQREIQIVERRGAAPDHPVPISCPETDYLKCLICRVN
jgi:23S rRNA (cytosine1962-C5)-methyltransferase